MPARSATTTLVALYRDALCLVYVPYDEDYGLATLEAFLAQKPVITARDSGGTLEFVRDGDNGFVVDPDPEAIAARDRAASTRDRALAASLGAHGRDLARAISWDTVHRAAAQSWLTSARDLRSIIPAFDEGPRDRRRRRRRLLRDAADRGRRSSSSTMARRTRLREQAAAAGARVIRHPYNKGNGASVKTGIRHASGEWILILDGDGQHRPEDALRLVSYLGDYDLVIGARSRGDAGDHRAPHGQRSAQRARRLSRRATAFPI